MNKTDLAVAVCGATRPDGTYILGDLAREPCTFSLHNYTEAERRALYGRNTTCYCDDRRWFPAILLTSDLDVGLLIGLLEEARFWVVRYYGMASVFAKWKVLNYDNDMSVGEDIDLLEAAAIALGLAI